MQNAQWGKPGESPALSRNGNGRLTRVRLPALMFTRSAFARRAAGRQGFPVPPQQVSPSQRRFPREGP